MKDKWLLFHFIPQLVTYFVCVACGDGPKKKKQLPSAAAGNRVNESVDVVNVQ